MSRKSRINKQRTSEVEARKAGIDEFDIAGNIRRRGEDPSPDDRERGERSRADRAGAQDVVGD